MGTCYFRIAGINVQINTSFDLLITEKFRPFLHDLKIETPDCVINTEECGQLPEKFSGEYKKSLTCYTGNLLKFRNFHYEVGADTPFGATCMEEGNEIFQWYLPGCEKYYQDSSAVFKYAGLENIFMSHERILLHASFIRYNGMGILFSAPSGTGKSTQAELWRTYTDAEIINGDRVALGLENSQWTAWGIPYAGTSGIFKNAQVPLGALVILRQGPKNHIQRLSGISALKNLYPEVSMHPWDRHYLEQAMGLLQKLINDAPVYLLECLPEKSAVEMLKTTLEEEGILR